MVGGSDHFRPYRVGDQCGPNLIWTGLVCLWRLLQARDDMFDVQNLHPLAAMKDRPQNTARKYKVRTLPFGLIDRPTRSIFNSSRVILYTSLCLSLFQGFGDPIHSFPSQTTPSFCSALIGFTFFSR